MPARHDLIRRNTRWLGLLVCGVCVLAGPAAQAVVYSTPVVVESEEDLYELYENGQLSDEGLDRLLEMFRSKVDPNTAERQVLFDLPGMTYPLVDALLERRAREPFRKVEELLSVPLPDEVLVQIRPFLRIVPPGVAPRPVSGRARIEFIDHFDDDYVPAEYFMAELKILDWVQLGFHGIFQEEFGDFKLHRGIDDPRESFLTTPGFDFAWQPARFLNNSRFSALVDRPTWAVVAGHFRAGFGQRLVFDNTDRSDPHGLYPDQAAYLSYESRPRFRLYEASMLGVGGRLKSLPLGAVQLDMTSFYSYRWRDSYFDQFYPHIAFTPNSFEPLAAGVDDLERSRHRVNYHTVRDVWAEHTFGGNVTVRVGDDAHVGATAYGEVIDWRLGGWDLFDFSPSSPIPNKRWHGASGIDFAVRLGNVSLFGEYAFAFAVGRSGPFGEQQDLFGHAGAVRALFEYHTWQLDLAAFAYSHDFANPRSRGTAVADEFRGGRGRNEYALSADVTYSPVPPVRLRAELLPYFHPAESCPTLGEVGDFAGGLYDYDVQNDLVAGGWTCAERGRRFGLSMLVRADWEVIKKLTLASWVSWHDKDLEHVGTEDTSFSNQKGSSKPGERNISYGRPLGQRVQWTLQLSTNLVPRTSLTAHYALSLLDDGTARFDHSMLMAHVLYGEARVRAFDWWTLVARLRWGPDTVQNAYYPAACCQQVVFDPLSDEVDVSPWNARGNELIETYLQNEFKPIDGMLIKLRYTFRHFVHKGAWENADDLDVYFGPGDWAHELRFSTEYRF